MSCCENPWHGNFNSFSPGVLVTSEMYGVNLSRVNKYPPLPPNKLRLACTVSQQRCSISSLVRHMYVGDLYLFSPFAVYSICVYVVCACVGCVLWPYQIAALTIQLRTISDPTKRVGLAAATSSSGGSILNQGSKSHINIRK